MLLLRQMVFIGVRSTVVIAVAGAFVGMIVAVQFYDTLVRFGSVSMLGAAVGLSLLRELGPLLTAVIVIGRAGSASCAEIAIMRTENQIDALECMAIDPYRFILAPRLLAFMLTVPLLTAMFNVLGIAGGGFVALVSFGMSPGTYFGGMADSVVLHDVLMGITKSLMFALVSSWICMGKAFLMNSASVPLFGAEGVGRITTDAVVSALIAVLFCDYIISAVML